MFYEAGKRDRKPVKTSLIRLSRKQMKTAIATLNNSNENKIFILKGNNCPILVTCSEHFTSIFGNCLPFV